MLYAGTNAAFPIFNWIFTKVSSIYLHYQCAENTFFSTTEQTIYKILYVKLKKRQPKRYSHINLWTKWSSGPMGPILHISSWRSIKTLKLKFVSFCFYIYCMDYNEGVGLCTVKRTIIPIRKIIGSSCCWCLHFCKSLDRRYPRKHVSIHF